MRIGGFTSSKARHAEDRGASWVLSATDISKGPARVIVRCLESKEDCSNLWPEQHHLSRWIFLRIKVERQAPVILWEIEYLWPLLQSPHSVSAKSSV